MTSFKSKIKTLNRILSNYRKYTKYNSIICYMEYEFLIINFSGKTNLFHFRKEKIPKSDIDTTIKRYRDKLRYAKNAN